MTTELISISGCIKELKISITQEEFNTIYNQELKNVQAKVKMPGFRPGKVPTKLILQQYGPSIKIETQENAANKYFKEYLQNNDLPILGAPAFTDLKDNEDGSQTYTIKLETLPDFDLKDYKSLEIFEPYHKVSDKEIEDEIEHNAKILGKKEETDIVTDYNHYVIVDSYFLNSDTDEQTDDKPYLDMPIDLSLEYLGEVREVFLNKKVGEEVKYFPNKEKNKEQKAEKFIIKKIEKIIPCEINDEFAKLSSQDKFDNLEDYKQEIGFALQKQWDDKTHQLMEEQIVSKVTELHDDVELPPTLVEEAKKQIINSYKHQNPNFDENESSNKEYVNKVAEKVARMELVQDKIIKKEKIEVEDYDYDNFVDEFLAKHPEFGQTLSKDVLLTQIKTDENLNGNLLKRKLIDLLLDFTKTNEIDYDEYINKNIHHNHTADCDCDEHFN